MKKNTLRPLMAAALVVGTLAPGASIASASTATVTATATAASTATALSSSAGAAGSMVAPEAPPSGEVPGGAPPGGSTTQTPAKGTRTISGETAHLVGVSIVATAQDTSGVLATNSAKVKLTRVRVTTSGSSSSSDQSSFYGLDAGILAQGGSVLAVSKGSVSTTGLGANGVFAYGTGTAIKLRGMTIRATGQYAHGIMAAGGGTVTATNVAASTTGTNSAVIATDRGSGTIKVTGGRYSTAGVDSPGIYSTGTITVDRANIAATGAEAAAVEGSNSITLKDTTLSGAAKSGVMIYQSFSGDATGSDGIFTMTGGSLSAKAGPLFLVTNATGTITLRHVKTSSASGILINAAAKSWGTTGSNGGTADLRAIDQKLAGNVVVDAISSATLTLSHRSAWTGAANTAATAGTTKVALDTSSTWKVTADSNVTTLTGAHVSGTRVTNIVGNGHTIHYATATSPELAGKTYTLTGGGTLMPA